VACIVGSLVEQYVIISKDRHHRSEEIGKIDSPFALNTDCLAACIWKKMNHLTFLGLVASQSIESHSFPSQESSSMFLHPYFILFLAKDLSNILVLCTAARHSRGPDNCGILSSTMPYRNAGGR
jgi:hypothetical protein